MKKRPKAKSIRGFFRKKFQEKGFVKAYEAVSPLMDVAIAIVDARTKAGLSQAELARKLDTKQSVISRIENGNQNLSVKILARIASILKCDLSVHLIPQKMAA